MTMAFAAPTLVAHPVAAVIFAPARPVPAVAAVVDVLPVRDCVRAAGRAGERSRW